MPTKRIHVVPKETPQIFTRLRKRPNAMVNATSSTEWATPLGCINRLTIQSIKKWEVS
jgi:hypothetical protein